VNDTNAVIGCAISAALCASLIALGIVYAVTIAVNAIR
jgi:hypothetical protein